jgi:TolA-binding protein
MNELSWILVAGLAAALVVQSLALRRSHRRQLAFQASVLQRSQLAMNNRLEKTKHQIGQLQTELSSARLQIKRLDKQVATAPSRAVTREKLERSLDDDATVSRRGVPADGFADTQPADTCHGSLLMQ